MYKSRQAWNTFQSDQYHISMTHRIMLYQLLKPLGCSQTPQIVCVINSERYATTVPVSTASCFTSHRAVHAYTPVRVIWCQSDSQFEDLFSRTSVNGFQNLLEQHLPLRRDNKTGMTRTYSMVSEG